MLEIVSICYDNKNLAFRIKLLLTVTFIYTHSDIKELDFETTTYLAKMVYFGIRFEINQFIFCYNYIYINGRAFNCTYSDKSPNNSWSPRIPKNNY